MGKYRKVARILTGALLAFTSAEAFAAPPTKSSSATPGTTIVDSTGSLIGLLFAPNKVEMNINGNFVLVDGILSQGFPIGGAPDLYYASPDIGCSSTPYTPVQDLPVRGFVYNSSSAIFASSGTIYYPNISAALSLSISSIGQQSGPSTSFPPPVTCTSISPRTILVAPFSSAPVNFSLPFKVQ